MHNTQNIPDGAVVGVLVAASAAVTLAFLAGPIMNVLPDAGILFSAAWKTTLAIAVVGFAVKGLNLLADRAARATPPPPAATHHCHECGAFMLPQHRAEGGNPGRVFWFWLGILGLFFFLVPGLICFAIGASLSHGKSVSRCPVCHGKKISTFTKAEEAEMQSSINATDRDHPFVEGGGR